MEPLRPAGGSEEAAEPGSGMGLRRGEGTARPPPVAGARWLPRGLRARAPGRPAGAR